MIPYPVCPPQRGPSRGAATTSIPPQWRPGSQGPPSAPGHRPLLPSLGTRPSRALRASGIAAPGLPGPAWCSAGVRQRRPHRRCDGGSFRGRRALSPAPPWVCPSVARTSRLRLPHRRLSGSLSPCPRPQARSEGRNRFQERGCGDPRPHGPRRVRGPGFPTSGGHSLRPGLRLLLFVPRPPWWVRGGVTGAPGDATSAPFRGCVGICVSPSGTRPLESLSVLRGYLGFSQQTAAQRSAESFIHSLIHSFSPSSVGRRA